MGPNLRELVIVTAVSILLLACLFLVTHKMAKNRQAEIEALNAQLEQYQIFIESPKKNETD